MVDEAGTPPQPTGQSDLPPESVQTPQPTAQVLQLVPPAAVIASAEGEGGDRKDAKTAKPEKVIDWGTYNYLLEHFTLIYPTDTVWDGAKRKIIKIGNMGHAFSNDMVRMWKASSARKQVDDHEVVFDPTQKSPAHYVNLFDGITMVPKKGDVGPILDLVRFLTSRASTDEEESDEIMHWLLQWFAYPLQNVGAKLRTSVVMHGDEGAGKNFLFDLVASIYGKYGVLVGQDELEDKFNDWRSCKLFVVGDEVSSRQELVHNKNRLKSLITSPTVQINPKNLPRREEANHMNVGFLSNEITPLALDNSDRRYLVIYTPRAKDFTYYKALGKWRDDGGAEAFYHFLLHYNLKDFDPYSPAPQTLAKRDLIDINRKSPELFWLAWHSGEIDLPYWPCSTTQAYRGYTKWCQRTGDRFPFKQNIFTRTLLRFSEGQDKPMREAVMSPKDAMGNYKSIRMLLTLPEQPPKDAKVGEWAGECRDAFETPLSKYVYGSSPRPPEGGFNGEGE